MTEADLQRAVIECARFFSWRSCHFRPARTERGWATPVAGDGRGFPDTVLVRDRVLWRELKVSGGRLRPDQVQWLDALCDAGQDAAVWTDEDWLAGRIEAELR